jgi:hypothetical protein
MKVLLCFITDVMQWRHGRSCASREHYVYVNGKYSVMNPGILKSVIRWIVLAAMTESGSQPVKCGNKYMMKQQSWIVLCCSRWSSELGGHSVLLYTTFDYNWGTKWTPLITAGDVCDIYGKFAYNIFQPSSGSTYITKFLAY